jgi:hypothetical protein
LYSTEKPSVRCSSRRLDDPLPAVAAPGQLGLVVPDDHDGPRRARPERPQELQQPHRLICGALHLREVLPSEGDVVLPERGQLVELGELCVHIGGRRIRRDLPVLGREPPELQVALHRVACVKTPGARLGSQRVELTQSRLEVAGCGQELGEHGRHREAVLVEGVDSTQPLPKPVQAVRHLVPRQAT